LIAFEDRKLKRGFASLLMFFPLSLEGEGDTGGEVDKTDSRMLASEVVEWVR